MKINTPQDRYHVKISRREKVLDVGGGNHPFKRAHVVVDKYEKDNTHRGGNLKVYKRQEFVNADGNDLPFEDKAFDYVNCCHVAEHVADPGHFFDEIARVGKRGYIEVPSLIGEFLAPKASHIWISLEVDDKLVMVRKSDLGIDKAQMDFGKLFLAHMSDHFLAYKILLRQYPDLFTVRQQWKDDIEYVVNPKDEYTLGLFRNPWQEEVIQERFKAKGKLKDTMEVWTTFLKLFTGKINRSLF
jgi:SAM-dependent methyltransferase